MADMIQLKEIGSGMANLNKICPLPWISMETTPMGGCRPCCLAKEEIPGIDLRTDTLSDAYKSDYMKDLREQFLRGEKPETCTRCWKEEEAGKISKRINSQIRLKHLMDKIDYEDTEPDALWFLDLKLGNICNLKCRICGSWSSSKWATEEIDYAIDMVNPKEHLAYQHLKKGEWPRHNPKFWEDLHELLPDVEYIEFTGGEPFMIPEHITLLDYAVANNLTDMELHYNTNGTCGIPYGMLDEFKKVEIAYSIDNVGERFEYERYGAQWNQVILAPTPLLSNIESQLCFTINIQNVYYLDKPLLWAKDKNFNSIHWNYLHDPWYMNVQYMTPEAKELVLANIEHNQMVVLPEYKQEWETLINFIKNGPGSDGTEFVQAMTRTDLYRNQMFPQLYPEMAKAMGYE